MLAVEWARRGVRVVAVAPGPVRTPMVEQAIRDGILVEDEIVDRMPAGRLAEPEDVARVVALHRVAEGGVRDGLPSSPSTAATVRTARRIRCPWRCRVER